MAHIISIEQLAMMAWRSTTTPNRKSSVLQANMFLTCVYPFLRSVFIPISSLYPANFPLIAPNQVTQLLAHSHICLQSRRSSWCSHHQCIRLRVSAVIRTCTVAQEDRSNALSWVREGADEARRCVSARALRAGELWAGCGDVPQAGSSEAVGRLEHKGLITIF